MTAEHLLQACPLHNTHRRQSVLAGGDYTVARKLFGSLHGGPAAHSRLRAGNRSVRLSVPDKKKKKFPSDT